MIQQSRRADEYAAVGTVARIERYEDVPDECLIFASSSVESTDCQSKWIVARGNAFVGLDRMR